MTASTPFENRPPDAASTDADGGFLLSRQLIVNGEVREIRAPETLRLDAVLRRELNLKSVLHGCESGTCGACRILVDGKLVASCTLPFSSVRDGSALETAEALGTCPRARAVVEAFLVERNTRCALCVGGLAVTAEHLDRAGCAHDDVAVDNALASASCACTGRGSLKRALLAPR